MNRKNVNVLITYGMRMDILYLHYLLLLVSNTTFTSVKYKYKIGRAF